MTSYRPSHRHQYCRGVSLTEMVIVVAILAVTASTAIMTASSVNSVSTEPAAWQVEQALQFARARAMSSSLPAVVRFDVSTNSLSVVERDLGAIPPQDTLLTHPMTKQPYDVKLFQPALVGSSPALRVEFKFNDMSIATEIGFLANGTPGKLLTNTDAIPLRDPYQWRGAWQAVMGYKIADKVAHPTGYYSATTNHNSATVFADDLNKGFWIRNDVEAQVILDARGHRTGVHVAPFTGFVRIQG